MHAIIINFKENRVQIQQAPISLNLYVPLIIFHRMSADEFRVLTIFSRWKCSNVKVWGEWVIYSIVQANIWCYLVVWVSKSRIVRKTTAPNTRETRSRITDAELHTRSPDEKRQHQHEEEDVDCRINTTKLYHCLNYCCTFTATKYTFTQRIVYVAHKTALISRIHIWDISRARFLSK